MPYFLVLLSPGPNDDAGAGGQPEHEPFIDWLDARNLVVLGGKFQPPAGSAAAGYVLSCSSLEEAQQLVARDPLVSSTFMRADIVEWQLVGLNPDAVEPELRQRSDNVAREL